MEAIYKYIESIAAGRQQTVLQMVKNGVDMTGRSYESLPQSASATTTDMQILTFGDTTLTGFFKDLNTKLLTLFRADK